MGDIVIGWDAAGCCNIDNAFSMWIAWILGLTT
jgi:hypothetical protein